MVRQTLRQAQQILTHATGLACFLIYLLSFVCCLAILFETLLTLSQETVHCILRSAIFAMGTVSLAKSFQSFET